MARPDVSRTDRRSGSDNPALAICRVPDNDPHSVTLEWANPQARSLVRSFLPSGSNGLVDLTGGEWPVVVKTAAEATRGTPGQATVHVGDTALDVVCTPIDPPRALLTFRRVEAPDTTAPDFRGLAAVMERMEGVYLFQMTTGEPVRALWVAGDSDRILGTDVKAGWDLDRILATIHPEDHAEYLRILDESVGSCVYRVIRPDGETRTLSRSWCTTEDRSGQTIRNGVVVDITARERLLHELRRSNRDLEAFAAVAAHELQSPARTIAGLAELVAEDLQVGDGSEPATSLGLIARTAERMQTQIRELLTWARAVGEGPASEPVDLVEVIDGVLENNSVAIAEAGAEVVVERLPWINGDAGQLHIVFSNLLSNACKYRDPDRPLAIKISAMVAYGEALVSVADTGTGFDMRLSADVFGLFRRVHSQSEYPGTGMGLPICRRIIEAHGGQISVTSAPGVGSTFTVRLPLHTPGRS